MIAPLLVVLVVVAAGAGGGALFLTLSRDTASGYTVQQQVCATHGSVRYCANPGYQGLIPFWRRVTDAVLSQVPGEVAARARLDRDAVRRLGARTGGRDRRACLRPGRGRLGDRCRDPRASVGSTCTVRNQARAIVQMWLAGQVSPKAANLATHPDPFADSITGTSYVKDTIHEGPLAGRYAAQLLAQPRGQIGRLVRANWTQLVDFRTYYARAEQLLGLSRVAPTPAELSSCAWPSTIVQLRMAPRGSGAAALSDALRAID